MGVDFWQFFQQDGAWSHAVVAVLDIHDEHFDDKVLSNCLPNSLDICGPGHHTLWDFCPCDYFLWGFVKDTIYRNKWHTFKELKQEIVAAVNSDSEETLNCSCMKFMTSTADGNGHQCAHILNICLHDCQFPKTTPE